MAVVPGAMVANGGGCRNGCILMVNGPAPLLNHGKRYAKKVQDKSFPEVPVSLKIYCTAGKGYCTSGKATTQ